MNHSVPDPIRQTVAVIGTGRLGLQLIWQLVDAGVRRFIVIDDGFVSRDDVSPHGAGFSSAHLSEPRARCAQAVISRWNPALQVEVSTQVPVEADIVVATGAAALDPQVMASVMSADLVHLPVVLTQEAACVGPVIKPGVDPCLRCMGLWRAEHDPQWARCAAGFIPLPTPMLALAAAHAGAQVMAYLAGGESPRSSIRLSRQDCEPSFIDWRHHPQCGCSRQPSDLVRAPVVTSSGTRSGTESNIPANAGRARQESVRITSPSALTPVGSLTRRSVQPGTAPARPSNRTADARTVASVMGT